MLRPQQCAAVPTLSKWSMGSSKLTSQVMNDDALDSFITTRQGRKGRRHWPGLNLVLVCVCGIAGGTTDTAKTKADSATTELEKYWQVVRSNPADFTGWTYLLQFVEQEVRLESSILRICTRSRLFCCC